LFSAGWVEQWWFRKTGTIGITLASEAEIGVWIQARSVMTPYHM